MLTVSNLTVDIGDKHIVDNISFSVQSGEWLMILGANGAGKSTIINAISQSVPYSGCVRVGENDVKKLSSRMRARAFGILKQNNFTSYSFSVEEVVRMGRYAYSENTLSSLLSFKKDTHADDEAVSYALSVTGLTELSGRSVLTLSGGELQRTFLAQIFAQNPQILILDEPTNHLDLPYQKAIFELIRNWLAAEKNRAVISVVHDLSLAKLYGTHALLLADGKQLAVDETNAVMTRSMLETAYSADVMLLIYELADVWQREQQ